MRSSKSFLATISSLFLLLLSVGCSSSSNSSAPAVVAPANLSYLTSSISVTVGQSIVPDIPTLTGSSASFAVNPALPAGISIASTTGVISGSPTATAAAVAYTISATNASGTTTAAVTIAVLPVAPTALIYPQTTLVATAGAAIAPDVPTYGGSGTFTIAPALPAGLTLNTTTGNISGAPSASALKASYTVTLSNPTGAVSTSISIAVLNMSQVLLDLGQVGQIKNLQLTGSRVLEQDATTSAGSSSPLHWALYNYISNAKIASGQQTQGSIALAGTTFVVDASTSSVSTLNVRSATDATLLGTIPSFGSWWQLSSDGSYIATGSTASLSIYSPQGALIATKSGNYSSAIVYASPSSVQVANGAAGANVIETLSASSGNSTLSPSFLGTFSTWFTDGSHFVATVGNFVYLYSNTAVQQGIMAFSGSHLGGVGNWFYGNTGSSLQIYAIGNATPVTSVPDTDFIASGPYLGILNPLKVVLVDLSGSSPIVNNFPSNFPSQTAFAANTATQYVVGLGGGAIVDGASLATGGRFFGIGSLDGLAASPVRAALNTRSNHILLFDSTTLASQPEISYTTATATSQTPISISQDGSILAVPTGIPLIHLGTNVAVLSLPSGALLNTFNDFVTFDLSNSGALFGGYTGALYEVLPVPGGNPQIVASGPSYLQVGQQTPQISPDDTLIAVSTTDGSTYTTSIYKNGALTIAVNGRAVGWLDNNRLLVDLYTFATGFPVYSSTAVVSPAGIVTSTPQLPELPTLQMVSSDQLYSAARNSIYSVTTGNVVWTGNNSSTGVGAVAGSHVIYVSDTQVLAEGH